MSKRPHDASSLPDETSLPTDGPEDGERSQGKASPFQETVRKVLLGGASALLNTEEGIRNALSEVRLPKEVLGYVLQQTERTRREVTGLVTKEVKKALRRVDARKELQRALVGLKVDVRATVRFRRDEDGAPDVRMATKARRKRRRGSHGKGEQAAGKALSTPATAPEAGPATRDDEGS